MGVSGEADGDISYLEREIEILRIERNLLTRENRRLKNSEKELKAYRFILSRISPSCDYVHHAKGEYHSAMEDCPVIRRYEELLGETNAS